MNKKIIHITLFILTIILWFFIWKYKFSSAVKNENAPTVISNSITLEKTKFDSVLILDYEDPFFKGEKIKQKRKTSVRNTSQNQRSNSSIKKKQNPSKIKDVQKEFKFPEVIYSGYMKNKSTEEKWAWIIINGEEKIKKEGQFIDSLFLVSISEFSIVLKYQQYEKSISRNK